LGNRRETRKAPRRIPSRGQSLRDGSKAPRSQSEPRDSTRQQSRGQSEFRGAMGRQSRAGRATDRGSKTGTKSR
jgi:hypothetical protein